MKNNIIILIVILASFFAFTACNSVKYVPKGEHLLVKNKLYIDGKNKGFKEAHD